MQQSRKHRKFKSIPTVRSLPCVDFWIFISHCKQPDSLEITLSPWILKTKIWHIPEIHKPYLPSEGRTFSVNFQRLKMFPYYKGHDRKSEMGLRRERLWCGKPRRRAEDKKSSEVKTGRRPSGPDSRPTARDPTPPRGEPRASVGATASSPCLWSGWPWPWPVGASRPRPYTLPPRCRRLLLSNSSNSRKPSSSGLLPVMWRLLRH